QWKDGNGVRMSSRFHRRGNCEHPRVPRGEAADEGAPRWGASGPIGVRAQRGGPQDNHNEGDPTTQMGCDSPIVLEACMAAPRIGITRGLAPDRPVTDIPLTYLRYHDRVREAGGEPVDLHPGIDASCEQILDDLDGVVICGGPDVNPSLYGQ